jgi:hypothetical protein
LKTKNTVCAILNVNVFLKDFFVLFNQNWFSNFFSVKAKKDKKVLIFFFFRKSTYKKEESFFFSFFTKKPK